MDCERDFTLTLGHEFVDRIAPSMDIMLRTARWLTGAVRARFDAFAEDLLETHAPESEITLDKIWYQVLNSFSADQPGIFEVTIDEFRSRWMQLLAQPEGDAVTLASSSLRERVDGIFGDVGAARATSSIHAPDLQIAATSAAALQRGDYQVVLGELHASLPTLLGGPFDWGLAVPSQTAERVSREQGPGRILPALPRTWPHNTARTAVTASRDDTFVAFAPTPGLD